MTISTRYCSMLQKRLAKYQIRTYKMPAYCPNTTVLGIETSCDDTGCAVVNGTGKILGESLYSQNITHLRYGGVNPLIAQELHRDNIETAVNEALSKADLKIQDVDAIAVTTRPGLRISLQVGVKYAKYLSKIHHKPLIPVHHMEAHALVARMYHTIPFPFLVLLISGGDSLLAIVQDVDSFLLLGKALDNAPGEVLDKAARRMKLRNIPAYSQVAGGKAIELAARKAKNPTKFEFSLPLLRNRDCNFSFSGLKESLVRKLMRKEEEHGTMGDGIIPEINDLCAAFQLAIAEHIVHRTERAVLFSERNNLIIDSKNIVVSGGVACNDFIFKSLQEIGSKLDYNVYRPPPHVCTDNGVMIAWNGIEKLRNQCDLSNNDLEVNPDAPLGKNIINEVQKAYIPTRVTRLKKLCMSLFAFLFQHLLVVVKSTTQYNIITRNRNLPVIPAGLVRKPHLHITYITSLVFFV